MTPEETAACRELACRWVDDRLDAFSTAKGTDGEAFWATLKAACELAHAAEWLLRAGDDRARAAGRRWLEFSWAQIEGGELLRAVVATDRRWIAAAPAFVPFHLAGRRHDGLVAALRAQLPRAELRPLEWSLIAPALRLLGIEPEPALVELARGAGVLARRPPLAALTRDEAYLLTHECLAWSRWGHDAPAWDLDTSAWVATALPAALERFVAEGDADIVAELILAARATRQPAVDPAAARVLAAAQTAEGDVASPPRATRHRRLEHPRLGRSYHSTLVAIMAWAG